MHALAQMVYPGRLIIIGADPSGESAVVVYAVTGRSPASQARRLEMSEGMVWTRPTDPHTIRAGNVDLLVYPAVIIGSGVAVSNGKQTADIDPSADENPVAVLAKGLDRWTYEPDAPIYTPRISGCVLPNGRTALSLIRRGPGGLAERSFHEGTFLPGRGSLVSTYAGPNANPLPAFRGEPVEVGLDGRTPEETAEAVYASLRPEGRTEDFRVAVACLFFPRGPGGEPRVAILNRCERTPS